MPLHLGIMTWDDGHCSATSVAVWQVGVNAVVVTVFIGRNMHCTSCPAQELESFYTEVHATQSKLPIFPQSYPASALLGCIDVVDCLPESSLTVHMAP